MNPKSNVKVTPLFDKAHLHVNLRQAICALAEALSLVGVDEHQHAERVAYVAVEIAKQLEWHDEAINDIFFAGLLHDCGVSSTRMHKSLISAMDWDGAILHCVLGEYYLKQFRPTAHLASVIRHHHTHWSDLDSYNLSEHTAIAANLIFMADRIDVLRVQHLNSGITSPREFGDGIIEIIQDHSPSHFSPELVAAFTTLARNEAFWYTLDPLELSEYIHTIESEGEDEITRFEELHQLAQIFARIVDAKSDFTYNHSVGVANLSRHLAMLMDLPPHRADLIEIAALLHDLGKLGVPDELLEKPAPLTAEETEIMHRHSYETFRILRHIKGFDSIAEWAGNHHETLLGDGYPFHHNDTELSIEARIIAIADIFQALVQDRPYRKGMSAAQALNLLQQMAREGRIDNEVVELLGQHLDSCWQHANSTHESWPPLSGL